MNHEPSDDLSAPERRAYRDLSRSKVSRGPSPDLEDRIVNELRRQGLVRSRGPADVIAGWFGWLTQMPAVPRYALAGAAVAGIFFLGVETGKRSGVPTMPEAKIEQPEEESVEPVDYGGEMMAASESSAPEGVFVKHVCADAPDGEPHICTLDHDLVASN